MTDPDAIDRRRALALDRGLRVASAERVERHRWGRALLNRSLPRVWELNLLLVERADEHLDPAALTAEADRLLGGAGLAHRRVFVDDDAAGERLEPGLTALGWQARPLGLMVHRRPLDRPADPALAREVDLAALQDVHRAFLRTQPYGADPEAVRQLLEADAVRAGAGRARHFAGFHAGRAACFLSQFSDGRGAAQLQSMATLPDARGHGLARNVMALGVHTASADHDHVSLATVEEVPWLRATYERMGFDLVGRWWAFTRAPSLR